MLIPLQSQLPQQLIVVLLGVLYQQPHIMLALLSALFSRVDFSFAAQSSRQLDLVHVVLEVLSK